MSHHPISEAEGRQYLIELAVALKLPLTFENDWQAKALLKGPNAGQPGSWSLRLELAQGANLWRWEQGPGFVVETLIEPAADGWLPYAHWEVSQQFLKASFDVEHQAAYFQQKGRAEMEDYAARIKARIERYQAGRDALEPAVEMLAQLTGTPARPPRPYLPGQYRWWAGPQDSTQPYTTQLDVRATISGPLPVVVNVEFCGLTPELAAELLTLHCRLTQP